MTLYNKDLEFADGSNDTTIRYYPSTGYLSINNLGTTPLTF